MGADADAVCGADYREPSSERVNRQRYRERPWIQLCGLAYLSRIRTHRSQATQPEPKLNTLVIGHHEWPVPPTLNQVDLPVLSGLQRRLGGTVTVLSTGRVAATQRFLVGDLRIVLFPTKYGAPVFCLRSVRLAYGLARDGHDPLTIVASDVWGGLVGSVMKRARGAAVVMNVQGHVLDPGPEYGSRLKRELLRRAIRLSIRRADAVRSLNAVIASEVRAVNPAVTNIVIGSRVDTTRFAYRGSNPAIADECVRVFCVGALISRKNQALLIRAVGLAHKRVRGIRLILAGTGPDEQFLRELAGKAGVADAVEFLGQVPNDDLPSLLVTADVFAFPSLSEGQPRAVLEAQSVGIPVVASDIPAHRDLITSEQTGLLLSPTDPRPWADAIVRLSWDEALRGTMSARARSLVESEHEFESQLDLFAALIRNTEEATIR
jgi:glycosyltransferase involved in cell wall biosynthesis